jgi:hypothetical protein
MHARAAARCCGWGGAGACRHSEAHWWSWWWPERGQLKRGASAVEAVRGADGGASQGRVLTSG